MGQGGVGERERSLSTTIHVCMTSLASMHHKVLTYVTTNNTLHIRTHFTLLTSDYV